AKHCNRAVTGLCGSADLLEKLGVNLYANPEIVKNTIEQVGLGFMFAPQFHPATRYATKPRRELGVRTIFNILGPLTNPADANAQLIGVYDSKLVRFVAEVLRKLECEEAMVVHGLEGLDEISIAGKTMIAKLEDGRISEFELTPANFNVTATDTSELAGYESCKNARIAFQILNGYLKGAYRDAVLVNAAAAIIVGGKADNFSYAVELAQKSLESGTAYEKLIQLVKASEGDISKLEELEKKYA
ncbi:MAG: anthranilate phosphoribosyltransferase, partial [Candidatus Bathyarchaeia archaeon]